MTATIPEMAPVTMGDRCSKVGKLVAVSWGHTDQDGDDSEDEGFRKGPMLNSHRFVLNTSSGR